MICSSVNDTKNVYGTYYLLNNNTVTKNAADSNRVSQYLLTTQEFDQTRLEAGITVEEACKSIVESVLLYKNFEYYIEVIFPMENSYISLSEMFFGAVFEIVQSPENIVEDIINETITGDIITSILTGIKLSSTSSNVTAIFGKHRIDYEII